MSATNRIKAPHAEIDVHVEAAGGLVGVYKLTETSLLLVGVEVGVIVGVFCSLQLGNVDVVNGIRDPLEGKAIGVVGPSEGIDRGSDGDGHAEDVLECFSTDEVELNRFVVDSSLKANPHLALLIYPGTGGIHQPILGRIQETHASANPFGGFLGKKVRFGKFGRLR
jgi:hypothetical protein